jgi:hypothetical protein
MVKELILLAAFVKLQCRKRQNSKSRVVKVTSEFTKTRIIKISYCTLSSSTMFNLNSVLEFSHLHMTCELFIYVSTCRKVYIFPTSFFFFFVYFVENIYRFILSINKIQNVKYLTKLKYMINYNDKV